MAKGHDEDEEDTISVAALSAYLGEMSSESERGQVLIACSLLDDTLLRLLEAFFLKVNSTAVLLKGPSAPLGSFSSRIRASYSSGLISETEFQNVEILRKVRNKFAHTLSIDFNDDSVRDLCRNLSLQTFSTDGEQFSALDNFRSAATVLNLSFLTRLEHVKPCELNSAAREYEPFIRRDPAMQD